MARWRAQGNRPLVMGGLALSLMISGLVPSEIQAKAGDTPNLVVWMVVDQGRGDLVDRLGPHLRKDGFNRLRQKGAWYSEAHYQHMATWTASGHAAMSSGTYPNRHGIMANKWYSGDAVVKVVYDPEGHGDTPGPWHLRVSTVADELHRKDAASKAVAVSIKDRAAILMGGHRPDGVYWLDKKSGDFIGRSQGGEGPAQWVQEFNTAHSIDAGFGWMWEQSLPESFYDQRGIADLCQNETDAHGLGKVFPRIVDGGLEAPGPRYYKALVNTPKATDVLFDLALEAIDGEGLGQDESPDLLMVSISSTDYLGHAYGPQSRESHEIFYHLDGQMAEFMNAVEAKVGKKQVGFVLTADHGAPPIPECVADRIPADRLWFKDIVAGANTALNQHFEQDLEQDFKWVKAFVDPGLYFDIPEGIERDEVLKVARQGLLQVDGILEVCDPADPKGPYAKACAYAMVPGRGPDLMVIPQPYTVVSDERYEGHGTTHGSPHRYDSHVLLGFSGPGIEKGVREETVDVIRIAPTVSKWLGVQAPAASEVEALPIFKD